MKTRDAFYAYTRICKVCRIPKPIRGGYNPRTHFVCADCRKTPEPKP
jgi:hypothetical protein